MSEARWHVLGAGAVGCLFASYLHRRQPGVTLLLRDAAPGGQDPVLIETESGTEACHIPLQGVSADSPISHLMVTTKAYDVRPALAAVRHRLQDNTRILLLANGMGFIEELRAQGLSHRIYCGTTTEGAYRLGPRHIKHAGKGETRIGTPGNQRSTALLRDEKSEEAPAWAQRWCAAIPRCQWEPDIDAALWRKLAINCAINPLTALNRCPNGALAERRELVRQVDQVCQEICRVSEAAGFGKLALSLHEGVATVIRGTAANRSSMLQDLEAGRRTEIDYITGQLLRIARQHGIPAPHNEELMRRILAIET
jgi:2-dehydropantoate 2-reductase